MDNPNKMSKEITALQSNTDYVVMDNVFANPKFIRKIGSGKKDKMEVSDIYTPKLFIEIISKLKPEDLEYLKTNENVILTLNIKEFIKKIDVSEKHGYDYLVHIVDNLQTTQLKWTEGNKEISTTIITKFIHEKGSGKIDLYVDSDLAKRLLLVKNSENFSFLTENFFKLKTSQAIKLYQFFKSWLNKGEYTTYQKGDKTGLDVFKEQFGFDTSGYKFWNNFKNKVLEPATREINEKTDIKVSYQTTGENLESLRPRVRGLIFHIKSKEKKPVKAPQTAPEEPTAFASLLSQVLPGSVAVVKRQAVVGEPSEAEIFVLSEQADLNSEQLGSLLKKCHQHPVRVWEILYAYVTASNKGKILNPFAYMISENSLETLGLGLWEAEKQKALKREAAKQAKAKEALLTKIKHDYNDRKKKQFLTLYDKSSDAEKSELLTYIKTTQTIKTIWGDKNYCIEKNKLNQDGQLTAGEYLAEQSGKGKAFRQGLYIKEVLEKHRYHLGYDENDQVLIKGLVEDTIA